MKALAKIIIAIPHVFSVVGTVGSYGLQNCFPKLAPRAITNRHREMCGLAGYGVIQESSKSKGEGQHTGTEFRIVRNNYYIQRTTLYKLHLSLSMRFHLRAPTPFGFSTGNVPNWIRLCRIPEPRSQIWDTRSQNSKGSESGIRNPRSISHFPALNPIRNWMT